MPPVTSLPVVTSIVTFNALTLKFTGVPDVKSSEVFTSVKGIVVVVDVEVVLVDVDDVLVDEVVVVVAAAVPRGTEELLKVSTVVDPPELEAWIV